MQIYSKESLAQAEEHIQWGQYETARTLLDREIAADPDSFRAHCLAAECHLEAGDFANASREISEVSRCGGDTSVLWWLRAKFRLFLQQYKSAHTCVDILLASHPQDPDLVNLKGWICLLEGKHEEALKLARRGLLVAPGHVYCANLEARALLSLGRVDEAIAASADAIQACPGFSLFHANLGSALSFRNRFSEAATAFLRAWKIRPRHSWTRTEFLKCLSRRFVTFRFLLKYTLSYRFSLLMLPFLLWLSWPHVPDGFDELRVANVLFLAWRITSGLLMSWIGAGVILALTHGRLVWHPVGRQIASREDKFYGRLQWLLFVAGGSISSAGAFSPNGEAWFLLGCVIVATIPGFSLLRWIGIRPGTWPIAALLVWLASCYASGAVAALVPSLGPVWRESLLAWFLVCGSLPALVAAELRPDAWELMEVCVRRTLFEERWPVPDSLEEQNLLREFGAMRRDIEEEFVPHLAVLRHPRRTFRRFLEKYSASLVLGNAALYGFVEAFDNVFRKESLSHFSLRNVVLLSMLAGPIIGIGVMYVWSAITRFVGRILGGQASARGVRAAFALGLCPSLLILPLIYLKWAAIGPGRRNLEYWQRVAPGESEIALLLVLIVALIGEMIAMLYSLGIYQVLLAEAHRFSIWRSLLTSVLSCVAIALMLLIMTVAFVYARPFLT